jgi:4-hydroxy-3-polyprenylbenzoate decarboxylase
MKIVVGMTGASGIIYGVKFVEFLSKKTDITLIISETAEKLLKTETNYNLDYLRNLADDVYFNHQMGAYVASGSNFFHSYVIVPCSISTMSKLALGIGDNLITRVGAVALKERRKMILALRETPLSTPILENMAKLSREGAVILPAAPPFYTHPQRIEDMVGYVVGKILDHIGIKNELYARY